MNQAAVQISFYLLFCFVLFLSVCMYMGKSESGWTQGVGDSRTHLAVWDTVGLLSPRTELQPTDGVLVEGDQL